MSQIRSRALGENNEPQWGQGRANYISDQDAVGQNIRTRLLLFKNEWWSDREDGTPWWQGILGTSSKGLQAINLILQSRILATPFVTGIQNLQSSIDTSKRSLNFFCEVQTQFGTVVIQNIPTPPPQGLPR